MGSSSIRCAARQTVGKCNSRIRHEIVRWLNQIKNADGSSLFIRFCTMGRKEEKTSPTIMVCCTSREASDRFAASLTRSGMLHRYPGSQPSSCDLPLEPSLVPRPLFDNRYQPRDPKTCTVDRIAPKDSDPGPCGVSGPRIGRRLEFMVASATGPRVQHATGGLIVRMGDELHQITRLDPLGDAMESSSVPKPHCDAEKCEYESVPGAEGSAYEQILSSEKSLLLQARLEQGETAKPQVQHPPAYGGICSSLGIAGGGAGHTLMWKHQEVPFTTPAPTELTLARHQDSAHYYTLVKLSELESSEASNAVIGGDGHMPPKLEALDIAAVGPEPARIVVVTARGPVSGTLLPDVASLRVRGSPHPQAVHAIILSEPDQPVDCGSAVIDAAKGSCYGHVIAGGEGDAVWYMVPAPDTLADMLLRFGRLPSLQLGRHTAAEHRDTVERWKCANPRGNTSLRPLAPLGKCESCSAGKLYSDRSRAAAHLRRKHFAGEQPPRRGKDDGWKDSVRRAQLPGAELKRWTKEMTVTPLYARVMQAESDSGSDYDNDMDDTDDEPDEPEGESLSAPSARGTMARQDSVEAENEELRRQSEVTKHEIATLEGDIDVLMEDREELKRELEYLRRRLWEQQTEVHG